MYFRGGNFDDDQLIIMRKALDDACLEGGVAKTDDATRNILAQAIIAHAKGGEFDPARLKAYAVARFRAMPPKK